MSVCKFLYQLSIPGRYRSDRSSISGYEGEKRGAEEREEKVAVKGAVTYLVEREEKDGAQCLVVLHLGLVLDGTVDLFQRFRVKGLGLEPKRTADSGGELKLTVETALKAASKQPSVCFR